MSYFLRGFQAFLIFWCTFSTFIITTKASPMSEISSTKTALRNDSPSPSLNGTRLKILPLGNSITYGFGSTDGNGFRKVLLDMLTDQGYIVQYVGSVRSGNMTDNQSEGHPGATISQIAAFANNILPERPNVILLMAGTNDMIQSLNLSSAPTRLASLIDLCHASCPDATIIVAQLTPSTDNIVAANIAAFNPTIPGIVDSRVQNGAKALVVDMSAFLTAPDLADAVHPNDSGYVKMAQAWDEGLKEAVGRRWITPPL